MPVSVQSKLPEVGTTIFTVMSQLANEHGAINLSQGFPSYNPPDKLLERVEHYLHHGANQYAPGNGVPALLQALADKTERLQGKIIDVATEITVCTGATEGAFSAILALVSDGDEVIVFDPAYDAYEPAITLAGGITRHVPLAVSDDGLDFSIDWQRLTDTLNERTRLVIVNFPHNPTGAILDGEDLDQLASVLRDTNTLLMSDEVYEHIVFDGVMHKSVLSNAELWQRSLVVCSFGKTFHATGWKVGYCIAPPQLTAEFRKVHQFATFSVNTPVQHALADFLTSDPDFYLGLSDFYRAKRDLFCRAMDGSRFRFRPARSTFFQVLDYSEISADDDESMVRRLIEEAGVAAIPLSVFCADPPDRGRLRFCFAKDDATLESAAQRLAEI